ncbi:MAG: ribosome-associated translation inhibitor RaiA [Methylobacteriaceae bacterium]|jgi:ribosomal subunit interface protein|nr:ribosome-associated translation inhibitor RaiA [Methylobacteriaceae bacterium]
MKIRASGKNFDIGESLRGQVEDRFTSLIDKYLDGKGSAQTLFSREGSGFRCDCRILLSSGTVLEASADSQDAYAAFDLAVNRIETRLKRHRSRIKTRGARSSEDGQESHVVVYEAPDQETLPEEFHPVIIAESTTTLPRLSVPEAVAELDLTGTPVLVFAHSGTGRVNVLYRRQDNAIGWVDVP